MKTNLTLTKYSLLSLGLMAAGLMAAPSVAQAGASGNINVVSKYVLRGITTPVSESDRPALQGGFDYAHESGAYAGWWASSLDYTYSNDGSSTSGNGVENDFYIGYAGGDAKEFNYDVGLIQYLYLDVDDSNLTEAKLKLGYGPFSAQMLYLLNDGWWGNQGDIYWTLNYNTPIGMDFNLGLTAGFYTYEQDDNADMCNPFGEGCGITTDSSGFRHVDVKLSHPIGKTGADMSLTYTFGGTNRADVDQEDTLVLGLSYKFDI
jgi:uncharacterized protein (TIGR02001 family)